MRNGVRRMSVGENEPLISSLATPNAQQGSICFTALLIFDISCSTEKA
jgi:hypothetical protein